MVPSEPVIARLRTLLSVLLVAAVAAVLAPALARAHDGESHDAAATTSTTVGGSIAAAVRAAGAEAPDEAPLADEPVIPGIEWATDFQIAPSGDVYTAGHDGEIRRYRRVGGSVAHPRYELKGTRIWKFSVTKQMDRGLIGIALDSAFDAGQPYLYALMTRGSHEYVGDVPGGSANRIRRTAQLVRIEIPSEEGEVPTAADLKVILGADAPADINSSCKPYTKGQAAASGETDALPNGVEFLTGGTDGSSLAPNLSDEHVYPDGDLATRADGAYDCIPTDGDTHGPGTVASAPDGSLFVSIGDSTLYTPPQGASLRTQNPESYVGKILHIDRDGRGFSNAPFCPQETDRTRICTKVWSMGLRNAYRISLLPPDAASAGQPVIAVGDVGQFTNERLTITHPGDNHGWPCWEGTYYNFMYAGPSSEFGVRSLWGGPATAPAPGKLSCERKTATGNGGGQPARSPDIDFPTLQYPHDFVLGSGEKPGEEDDGAAIVTGPRLEVKSGRDAAVALPDAWAGSLIFGDYVRGWLYRVAPDPDDPQNLDLDGGLRVGADEGRSPRLQTDFTTKGESPDPLLDRIAEPPARKDDGQLAFARLTSRQGPDGSLWYVRYGWSSGAGGIYRLRMAAQAPAQIASVTGACTSSGAAQGAITLEGENAGPGASYAWDINGDGVNDPGRTGRTTVITPEQLAALAGTTPWVRLTVTDGASTSVAARYVCAGPTPRVSITSPPDGVEVVLGEPTVVKAARAAGDAVSSGIPDSALRWKATTFHGGDHQHDLLQRTSPFETVDGEQRMQVTVTPDAGHELDSFTQVRIYAPQADGNNVAQAVRLVPKKVAVTLQSSPAGARVSLQRDGPASVVESAPGSVEMAAGYATAIAAANEWVDRDGTKWRLRGWSDGRTGQTRPWRVPADGGAAPIAEYENVGRVEPSTPLDETTPQPTSTPDPGPQLPAPKPLPPAAPTVGELANAPLATTLLRGRGAKVTGIRATLDLQRRVSAGGLVIKAAVRDADCRWWSFGRDRFVGQARSAAEKSSKTVARRCVRAPSWKHVSSSWVGETAVATVELGKALPRGRYALRLRVQNASGVLAERVRAIDVK